MSSSHTIWRDCWRRRQTLTFETERWRCGSRSRFVIERAAAIRACSIRWRHAMRRLGNVHSRSAPQRRRPRLRANWVRLILQGKLRRTAGATKDSSDRATAIGLAGSHHEKCFTSVTRPGPSVNEGACFELAPTDEHHHPTAGSDGESG